MSYPLPEAPRPVEAPVAAGTRVVLDARARFLDRDFVLGGSPRRLLRLPGGSAAVARRWRDGDKVRHGEERFARTLIQQGLLVTSGSEPIDPHDIDVIIPVCDDPRSLRALLEGLGGFEVTVVDDASNDPQIVRDCAQEFGARLVRLEVNSGPGAARNAGARSTARPFLWFLDVDVSLEDAADVARRLSAHLRDPLVSAAAPRIRGAAGSSARERFERRFSPLDMGQHSALVVPGGAVPYVPSACLFVRRDAFGEGFDEGLRTGEDVDLVWRLHDRGWLVRYDARILVSHRARDSWRRWWSQRVGYGASSGDLARRHGVRLAPVRVDTWTLIAVLSVICGRPLLAGRIVRAARDQMIQRVSSISDQPRDVANAVVVRGMSQAALPLVRSTVRTFGVVILVAALHPRLRWRALLVFLLGTIARGRSVRMRPREIPLAVADDLAYSMGVVKGAWRNRSMTSLRPSITRSTLRVADVLGLARRPFAP
ncbi:MAG: mycofactocin system glycosyltransferase [Acidimicrobiaceae bacterium]|nr:mycofactocin system glycosyltransferase [Acidimicrobiaceae bacterium]